MASQADRPSRAPQTDPLIGDAEVVAIRFEPLRLTLELLNQNVGQTNHLCLFEVAFYQLAGDGPLILDGIVKHDSVASALRCESIGNVLKNSVFIDDYRLDTLILSERYRLYELVLIRGAVAFVICSDAALGQWRTE